jgi:hypothetical protein
MSRLTASRSRWCACECNALRSGAFTAGGQRAPDPPISRSNSLSGAKVAVTRANSQKARILVRLLEFGPQTDSQVALALGLPEARISARRSPMVKDGLIAALDSVKAPSGARSAQR